MSPLSELAADNRTSREESQIAGPRMRPRLTLLIVSWIAVQIAFASTAFRVDETNILAIARQIAAHPLDPYGFNINWLGVYESAFDILANPPLVPAWLALSAKVFGWSEFALHASMIPWSVIGILAMASLSRDLRLSGMTATLLMVISPAYVLCSQVVMPDAAMTALFMAAVAGALRYRATGSKTALAVSIAAGFLTPLAKYNGVLVLPVLATLWLISATRRKGLAATVLGPALGLLSWSAYSFFYYGRVHFLHIAEFEQGGFENILSSLVPALGIAVIPLAAMAYSIRLRRAAVIEVASLAVAVLFAAAGFLAFDYRPLPGLLFGLSGWVCSRVFLTALAVVPPPRQWRDDRVVMIVWIAVGLVMQFHVLFSSVRYLLLLLPPLLILLLMSGAVEYRPSLRGGMVAVCAVLALSIAIGDARTANISRTFVREVLVPLKEREPGRFFFDGHWGFQYYCEQAGGTIINGWHPPKWRDGDLFVIARNPFPFIQSPPKTKGIAMHLTTYRYSPRWPVRTIDCSATANFYGPGVGRCKVPVLPFGFSTEDSDEFAVYRARPERR